MSEKTTMLNKTLKDFTHKTSLDVDPDKPLVTGQGKVIPIDDPRLDTTNREIYLPSDQENKGAHNISIDDLKYTIQTNPKQTIVLYQAVMLYLRITSNDTKNDHFENIVDATELLRLIRPGAIEFSKLFGNDGKSVDNNDK
jgi:hypothetical protein